MLQRISTLTRLMLLALMLAGTGCRNRSPVLATVLAVKGEVVEVGPPQRTLEPGAMVGAPSTIRSSAESAGIVSALPGVMIRLEELGEIGIEELDLRKHVDEMTSRDVRLDYRRGRLLVWTDEFRHGSIDVRIRTPAGDLRVQGPAFAEVEVKPANEVRVICVGGSLSVAETTLSAGQWTTLRAGSPRPAAEGAADTDDVWRALLRARDLEPQLLNLLERQRERTPVRGLNALGPTAKK